MQRLDDAQKRAGAFAARAQMSPQDRALFDAIPDQPWLAEPPRVRRSTKGKTLESRRLRCARVPRRSLPYRYVRRHGVMAVLDVFLSSGQVRTLQYLICRTGKGLLVHDADELDRRRPGLVRPDDPEAPARAPPPRLRPDLGRRSLPQDHHHPDREVRGRAGQRSKKAGSKPYK